MKNFIAFCLLFIPIFSFSQSTIPDSIQSKPFVKIILEDGIEKTGYVIFENDTEIKIYSREIGFLRIQKLHIRKIETANPDKFNLTDDSENDYSHHYAFSNSAILPSKGQLFLRDPMGLNGIFDLAITDRFTIGLGAFSFVVLNANLRYKFDLSENLLLTLSGGFYYSYLAGPFSASSTIGSGRATLTMGTAQKNFSVSGMFISNFNRIETGMATFSSIVPINHRSSFVTDFFIAPDLRFIDDAFNYMGLGFMGFRLKTKRNNRLDLGIAGLMAEYEDYNWQTGITDIIRFFIPFPYAQLSFKL